MVTRRIAISALFTATIAALPFSPARAQYAPPCSFPLAWPFCIAGAAVNAAATIATAPLYAVTAPPYYYYPQPAYYYPPRRHVRHHVAARLTNPKPANPKPASAQPANAQPANAQPANPEAPSPQAIQPMSPTQR
jgi:hypothetical protein